MADRSVSNSLCSNEIELRARWQTQDGQDKSRRVLDALKKGRVFEKIDGVEMIDGRVDLRGLAVPRLNYGTWFSVKGHSVQNVSGPTVFRRCKLEDIDLSCCDFGEAMWTGCNLRNVRFNQARLCGVGFWGCALNEVNFDGADMHDAILSGVDGSKVNTYVNVSFRTANLQGINGEVELYRDCDFSRANLKIVFFNGARFEGCTFAGLLSAVTFSLHAKSIAPSILPWHRLDPMQFTNRMWNVDFSNAELRGVVFDGVDLSTCTFPNDENHIVVHQQRELFTKAKALISSEWHEPERTWALGLIDIMYLWPGKLYGRQERPEILTQQIQVINRLDMHEALGYDAGERFYALVVELAK